MDIENILRVIGALLFMGFFLGFCIFIHELGHFLAAKWIHLFRLLRGCCNGI